MHSAEIALLSSGAAPEEGEHRFNNTTSFTVDVRGVVWWYTKGQQPTPLKVSDQSDKRFQYVLKKYPVVVDDEGFVQIG